MAKIRWTSEAETWLRDIYDYIATDYPHAAITVAEGIYNKAQTLRNFLRLATYIMLKLKGKSEFYCMVTIA
jgi:plasmid stabilization system protein ParE